MHSLLRAYGRAVTDPDLQIRGWGVAGGGGLVEVLQEKEKRALGNKTACILSFFLNGVKIEGVVLNRVRVSNPQRLTYTQIVMDDIDLARAKSEALENIYSLLKQNIKSCYAKRRRQRER